jgi:hypothetical protein
VTLFHDLVNHPKFLAIIEMAEAQRRINKHLGGEMFPHEHAEKMIACAVLRNVPVQIVGGDEHVVVLRVGYAPAGMN